METLLGKISKHQAAELGPGSPVQHKRIERESPEAEADGGGDIVCGTLDRAIAFLSFPKWLPSRSTVVPFPPKPAIL